MSEARKGKTFTEEHKLKISLAQKGEKGNNYGKQIPQEIKDKISKTVSNQVWMNNGIICKRVDKNKTDTYIKEGFVFGRLSFRKGSTTIEKVLQEKDL